ncbi:MULTISPECIES: alpha-ketoglutarate-dependent dioxygenase AlkB [Legionella]|uniref:Alpha-ketoglutarate-dependent dioxygenase AlkB n=1 Tax=Legionella septentrionalis TaxID=2498109 RepID=A0A433JI20_9GAMM|nr:MULTISPECIES: alpha-ketoglutarate-dependent dioxygenase AlkB [Legionella]MCP0912960.1 alpha-ketoglutarate-dependent dioxygenase AlkB [Legionella sp. 27cVA30]RUQ84509.1 alpha-ketoglutarate-dependent dioxygenase AlkB [Legionella septentrionalis]RUQ96748.1 alpha-ketoglutarate-dependent dioxygenase AlkB [Legionella septentrionalis]RUR10147.1 alpha-ketoglutarate-dependent dioxygenase AlkB [Legionella septentrionalis]RUR15461.1 alpha-ketoglutarate-dependent dioxygenase AlkB [Legionella septentrio
MSNQSIQTGEFPPGFSYFPAFISSAEEKILLDEFKRLNWQEVRMHGQTARRKVVHFGLNYAYATRQVNPTFPPPPYLHDLMDKTAGILGVTFREIAEILISNYPSGAGIGWHLDAPVFAKIVGVSLGSACTIKLRATSDHKTVLKKELHPRSAYVLSNIARTQWQHSITAVKNLRYSITLRTLHKL